MFELFGGIEKITAVPIIAGLQDLLVDQQYNACYEYNLVNRYTYIVQRCIVKIVWFDQVEKVAELIIRIMLTVPEPILRSWVCR